MGKSSCNSLKRKLNEIVWLVYYRLILLSFVVIPLQARSAPSSSSGACCYTDPLIGGTSCGCIELKTDFACDQFCNANGYTKNGFYPGEDCVTTIGSPSPCLEYGACCDLAAETCVITTDILCGAGVFGANKHFIPCGDCDDCPDVGTCCYYNGTPGNESYACLVTTQIQCNAFAGWWDSDNWDCAQVDDCDEEDYVVVDICDPYQFYLGNGCATAPYDICGECPTSDDGCAGLYEDYGNCCYFNAYYGDYVCHWMHEDCCDTLNGDFGNCLLIGVGCTPAP